MRTILVILVLICACSPIQFPIPKKVIVKFTQCYDPKNIEAENAIRIDGYYAAKSNNYNGFVNSYMFYNDGCVAMNVHGVILYSKDFHKYPTTWGTYVIKNDTIITQIILHNFESSACLESKFKIINKEKLIEISTSSLVENSITYNDSKNSFYLLPFYFQKLETKPDSTCWLKEKNWFWCNEQDWKNYMNTNKL